MHTRLLGSVPAALTWLAQRGVRGLVTDSRSLQPGDAFIAWPGHSQDARVHVEQALRDGARACIVEDYGIAAFAFDDERIASMQGLKAVAGPLASAFFGSPSDRLAVIAVTGTNGKTSTTWWTAQALASLGRRCGVIGTLGVGVVPSPHAPGAAAALTPTGLTTPDPVTLHRAFKGFVDAGLRTAAIEASSIGLAEGRLWGTHIDIAVFTNFSQDHLDFHGSMEAYWQAKADLFAWPGLRAAVINIDDPRGEALQHSLAGSDLRLWTCSQRQPARLCAHGVHHTETGLAFELVEAGLPAVPVRTQLIGDYNVSNLLSVVGSLRVLGLSLEEAARICATLTPVPGRMQRVCPSAEPGIGLPEVLVDYAHTPDALDKALRTLQPLAAARGGALWCVFGCGGNRDAGKRPLMGAIASALAQQVVVTSDNPRHEKPAAILAAITAGIASNAAVTVIEDRQAAIAHAVAHAAPADVVLIAGKGHETYQDIAGVKHPFSDVDEAMAALTARCGEHVVEACA
jgi:UDP-N-acetylmuramoyl-L-alanyl-D-glutamate--2,6-diaminopimelate ligase